MNDDTEWLECFGGPLDGEVFKFNLRARELCVPRFHALGGYQQHLYVVTERIFSTEHSLGVRQRILQYRQPRVVRRDKL